MYLYPTSFQKGLQATFKTSLNYIYLNFKKRRKISNSEQGKIQQNSKTKSKFVRKNDNQAVRGCLTVGYTFGQRNKGITASPEIHFVQ